MVSNSWIASTRSGTATSLRGKPLTSHTVLSDHKCYNIWKLIELMIYKSSFFSDICFSSDLFSGPTLTAYGRVAPTPRGRSDPAPRPPPDRALPRTGSAFGISPRVFAGGALATATSTIPGPPRPATPGTHAGGYSRSPPPSSVAWAVVLGSNVVPGDDA